MLLFLFSILPAISSVTSTVVGDGITYFISDDGTYRVHYTEIDMSNPYIYFRVTREHEAPTNSTNFAALTDSIVTINGDWIDTVYNRPLGLSIGDGWHWSGTHDWDGSINPPGDWSFFSCTAGKDCFFDPPQSLQEVDPIWQNVIGGNGALLVIDGVLQYPVWDNAYRARSAMCMDITSTVLYLVVVEGDGANGYSGMTPSNLASFMFDLGCWNAMSLDGGGSSDLIISGTRVNTRSPSEPYERSLYNHFSVIQSNSTDPECSTIMNGRYCDGDTLHVCQGGKNSEGDCSYFGATCEEGDGSAYCVHPYCTNGGNTGTCGSSSILYQCYHGALTEIDCSVPYGLFCESYSGGGRCTPMICTQGGDASWCDGSIAKSCTPTTNATFEYSTYSETDCASNAMICLQGACIDTDLDDDGYISTEYGGNDCDDNNNTTHPNALDTHTDGSDQNCDGIDGVDMDGDGHPDYIYGGTDCDDNNSNSTTTDNDADCDGYISTEYGGNDCQDQDASIHPNAEDNVQDGIDQNCDGNDGEVVSEPTSEPNSEPSSPTSEPNSPTSEPTSEPNSPTSEPNASTSEPNSPISVPSDEEFIDIGKDEIQQGCQHTISPNILQSWYSIIGLLFLYRRFRL